MRVWTYQGTDHDITSGAIDMRESKFYKDESLHNVECAYAELWQWTGTEMIIWGGKTSGGATNTGTIYNPATDSWRSMSATNAPSARWAHCRGRCIHTLTHMPGWDIPRHSGTLWDIFRPLYGSIFTASPADNYVAQHTMDYVQRFTCQRTVCDTLSLSTVYNMRRGGCKCL